MSKNVQRQALAIALSAVLTLTACGGGDGPDDAVTGFADAVAEEDYAAACEYLSSEVQAGAEDAGGCAAALETTLTEEDISQAEGLEAEVVEEDDDTATVETSVEGEEPETVELVKEDDEWRISGVP